MKKVIKIIAVGLLTIGVVGGAFAYSSHQHWKMSPTEKAEFVNKRIAGKLDLTEIQQLELKVLTDKLVEMIIEVKDSRHAQMDEIHQLVSAPVFDQGRALQLVQQKTEMINLKAPELVASLAGFLDSLDSSQKSELEDFMKHHKHNRHNKWSEK
jgi:Spy/CpxP family protein refolding chaperone